MPKTPAGSPGTVDRVDGGWNALVVAYLTSLLDRLGSECMDLQGLRKVTVTGPDLIARPCEDRPGRVAWELDWGSFDPSVPARSSDGARAPA